MRIFRCWPGKDGDAGARWPGGRGGHAQRCARRGGAGPAGAAPGGAGVLRDRCRERPAGGVAGGARPGHRCGRGRHGQLRLPAGPAAGRGGPAGLGDQLPGPVPPAPQGQERPSRCRERRPYRAGGGGDRHPQGPPRLRRRAAAAAAHPAQRSQGPHPGLQPNQGLPARRRRCAAGQTARPVQKTVRAGLRRPGTRRWAAPSRGRPGPPVAGPGH